MPPGAVTHIRRPRIVGGGFPQFGTGKLPVLRSFACYKECWSERNQTEPRSEYRRRLFDRDWQRPCKHRNPFDLRGLVGGARRCAGRITAFAACAHPGTPPPGTANPGSTPTRIVSGGCRACGTFLDQQHRHLFRLHSSRDFPHGEPRDRKGERSRRNPAPSEIDERACGWASIPLPRNSGRP